jgi:uncharacterized membrane protein
MSAGLMSAWEEVRSSLYFVPGLLVAGAAALAFALLAVDGVYPNLGGEVGWLFGGSASAGRSLLSTIATSLITVVSIAFSVTMVALQQAATSFTPRVLRTFTRDTGNQVVLGAYIGTFAYALLVMRQIREGADGAGVAEFVPALSISVAIVLALVALALLVYYVHHTSRALEVSWILDSIAAEAEGPLEKLFPRPLGRDTPEPAGASELLARLCPPERQGRVIRATAAGYLRWIDLDQLEEAAPPPASLIRVHPAMGAYVLPGEPVFTICPDVPLDAAGEARLLAALAFGPERSVEQDELFAVRQMVDIAVKALSPGVNDPTTAEQSLDRIGLMLARLIRREYPSPVREAGGKTFLFNRPGFADHVGAAFDQIRRASASSVHVSMYLIDLAGRLAAQAPTGERRRALLRQVDAIVEGLPSSGLPRADQALIAGAAAQAAAGHGVAARPVGVRSVPPAS